MIKVTLGNCYVFFLIAILTCGCSLERNTNSMPDNLKIIINNNKKVIAYSLKTTSRDVIFELADLKNKKIFAILNPVASHDGNMIAFWGLSRNNELQHQLSIWIRDSKKTIDVVRLKIGKSLAWSPDNSKIAFLGNKDYGHPNRLYVFELASKELIETEINDAVFLASSAWTPNGKKVLYQNSKQEICFYNFNEGKQECILSGEYPSISFDGKYIAFKKGNYQYLIYSIENANAKHLIDGSPSFLSKFTFWGGEYEVFGEIIWVPNEPLILYSRIAGIKGSDRRLYLYNLDTKQSTFVGELTGFYPNSWAW